MAEPLWKTDWWFLQNQTQSACDPAIPLLGTFPKEVQAGTARSAGQVHSSIIPNSQKTEATLSTDG